MSEAVQIVPRGEVRYKGIDFVSGDGTVAEDIAGKFSVLVALVLNMQGGANTVTFTTDAGNVSGAMDVADDGFLVLPFNPHGWFRSLTSISVDAALATRITGHSTWMVVESA